MIYNIDFSQRLIEAVNLLINKNSDSDELGRAVLYLSLLSCEISLKHLLESAKMPIEEIKRLSHNCEKLLDKLSNYIIYEADYKWYSAALLRGFVVDNHYSDATVGKLLKLDKISSYPNEIRYGDSIHHYNPIIMLRCAEVVCSWVLTNRDKIRLKTSLQEMIE